MSIINIPNTLEDDNSDVIGELVDLNDTTSEAATSTKQLLYDLASGIDKLNQSLAIIIRHLSLLTDVEIEEG